MPFIIGAVKVGFKMWLQGGFKPTVNFGFKAEKLLKTWSHLEAAEASPEELQFGASPEATLEANILKPTLTAPNETYNNWYLLTKCNILSLSSVSPPLLLSDFWLFTLVLTIYLSLVGTQIWLNIITLIFWTSAFGCLL